MISLTPTDPSTARKPGDTLEIDGAWELDLRPLVREARLVWYIQSQGAPEARVVATQEVRRANEKGTQRFQFTLPEWPYSYTGRLFSLQWAVDLVLDDQSARWEFTLGPDGKPVAAPPQS